MFVIGDCYKMRLVVISFAIDLAVVFINLTFIGLIDLQGNSLHS